MPRWRLVAVVVAAAVGLATAASGQTAGQLSDLRDRVREVAAELESARSEAASADEAVAEADARMAELESVVNDLARRVEHQEQQVAQARSDLDRHRHELARIRAAFETRAVELFKTSFDSTVAAVLSAGDIQTAVDRRVLLRAVNRSDLATMEQLDAARARVEVRREILRAEVARLTAIRDGQEQILQEVRAVRASRALAAADARARVEELASRKEDLEADQERLERLIRRRASAPRTISTPSVDGYVWPLCGRVTSGFGRRWGRLHAGLDIDDNRSRAIVAAKGGVVVFAGWSGGYGQLTLVDHGDGVVTAYAHQAAILVGEGQRVTRGQRIGTVGTTGSSTGTHLHFETRVNGSAVDPRRFLTGGC